MRTTQILSNERRQAKFQELGWLDLPETAKKFYEIPESGHLVSALARFSGYLSIEVIIPDQKRSFYVVYKTNGEHTESGKIEAHSMVDNHLPRLNAGLEIDKDTWEQRGCETIVIGQRALIKALLGLGGADVVREPSKGVPNLHLLTFPKAFPFA